MSEGLLWRRGSAVASCRNRGTGSSSPRRHGMWPKSSWKRLPYHRACSPNIELLAGQPTNWRTIISEKFLALLQRFYAPHQTSQLGDLAKGLVIPGEFDFEGQRNLITEFPQDYGKWRFLEGTNKTLCALGPKGKEQ